jgi:hypothetical protein
MDYEEEVLPAFSATPGPKPKFAASPLRRRFFANPASLQPNALCPRASIACSPLKRPVPGLIRDTFRLAWDSLYWNTRKSWHIARGRRGQCPCQVSSDSGKARETGCEAVLAYASPARFRRVCPLLTTRANGDWACSVDAEDVRPFWGRAAFLLGVAAFVVLLLASIAAFGLMRGIGYDVSYRDIVWPPAWGEFHRTQADFYRQRAAAALAEGDLAASLLLLSNAYELEPTHYQTGIQLAQLWQSGQPLLSDQTYARLLAEHPYRRDDTSRAWFRALLARGDFGGVQRLAGQRILHSGADVSPAWTQAFLFSTRQLGDPAGIDALLASAGLAPWLSTLLSAERELYRRPAAGRIEIITTAALAADRPHVLFHWLGRLLDEGRADLVFPRLLENDSILENRDRLRLQLDALAVGAPPAERAALVRHLLDRPASPPVYELLSSHLAAHPDRELLAAYAEKLARDPLPPGDARYPQLLAFFAACGAHRDAALMQTASAWLADTAGQEIKFLPPVRDAFMRIPAAARLENILPALQPMPLETTYALYARLSPPPPFPL